jgi:hypothetical protein
LTFDVFVGADWKTTFLELGLDEFGALSDFWRFLP